MRVNPYIAGNPISGGNGFFGRSDIFREVMQVLRQPQQNAIVLYGQRRIGKTSVLYQLEQQLAATQEFTPVYFDLQDKADKSLSQVLAELAQKIAHVVGLSAPDTALFDAEGEYFRQQFLPQASAQRELVLLFDEFDVLDSPQQNQAGQAFFPYLRRWMADIKRVYFVFVIGRRPEDLSTNTIATLKGVRTTRVSRLSPENAAKVVRQSEQNGSLDWSPEAVKRVWDWAQGHPYFTQLLCSVVWEQLDEEEDSPAPATAAQVDKAIDQALQQGANPVYWIWEGLPPAERVVMAAMAEVTEEVITRDRLVEALNQSGVRLIVRQLEVAPDTLVEWDVLQPIQGGYRFTVPLLRQWVVKNRPLRRVKEELDRLEPMADRLFQTGQDYYRMGNPKEAEDQLRRAIGINPNHLKARLLLGQILLEGKGIEGSTSVPTTGSLTKTLEEAVTILEEAYQYDPESARSHFVRSLLAVLNYQNDEAEQMNTMERILKIQPDQPIIKPRWEAVWLEKGHTALQQGQYETALTFFEKIYDVKTAQNELVRSLVALIDNQDDEATQLDAMEYILKLQPGQPIIKPQWKAVWLKRGDEALQKEQFEEALANFKKIKDVDRVEQTRKLIRKRALQTKVDAASKHETEEKWHEAIALYQELLQEFPNEVDWQTRLQRAQTQSRLSQRYNEALNELETGETATAQRLLAEVIALQPNYKEADRYLLRANRDIDWLILKKDFDGLKTTYENTLQKLDEAKRIYQEKESNIEDLSFAAQNLNRQLSTIRAIHENTLQKLSEAEKNYQEKEIVVNQSQLEIQNLNRKLQFLISEAQSLESQLSKTHAIRYKNLLVWFFSGAIVSIIIMLILFNLFTTTFNSLISTPYPTVLSTPEESSPTPSDTPTLTIQPLAEGITNQEAVGFLQFGEFGGINYGETIPPNTRVVAILRDRNNKWVQVLTESQRLVWILIDHADWEENNFLTIPTTTPTATPKPKINGIINQSASVWENPESWNAFSLGNLGEVNEGEIVTITGRNDAGDWLKIRDEDFPDGGWVKIQFVDIQGDIDDLSIESP